MLVSLIIAALAIVYALIFCSGILNQVAAILEYDAEKYETRDPGRAWGAEDLYYASQAFSDLFLVLGIVLIVVIVLLYIAACNKRRKYYITNYIAIGIAVVFELVYAVLLIANVAGIHGLFNLVDLGNCQYYYEEMANSSRGAWNATPWTLYLGYVLFALVILDAVALVLNLVWKLKLMKGEKELLGQGKEVVVEAEVV